MEDKDKLVEELQKALEERARIVVANDPQCNRLQGALDYALGNIKLPEEGESGPAEE